MEAPSRQAVKIPVTTEGFERLKSGHPWLFASHLAKNFPAPHQAGVVFLGEHPFFYSPQSEIRLRRLGPSQRQWIDAFVEPITELAPFRDLFGTKILELLEVAYLRRRKLLDSEECFRWIFSEADQLPGLVVDVYGQKLVAQIQTAPIEKFWPVFKELLLASFQKLSGQVAELSELRNSSSRKKEGLEVIPNAAAPNGQWQRWNGLEWWMSPGQSQKTGSYMDQRDNHLRTLAYAQKMKLTRAWDLCTFEGGFGLHLAKAGIEVLAVDQSQEALDTARKNAEHNQIPPERMSYLCDDVFTFLRTGFDQKKRSPLIVLDPPSFLKNKSEKMGALKGFKELNLRALHCTESGGLLVSCVCSHNIRPVDYERMLMSAAHDARRTVRILEVAGPAPDHAPLLGFTESSYLQAWYLEVL